LKKPKEQPRMDNLEIIATLHAQVEDKQTMTVHNTTQKTKKMSNTNFTIQPAVSP
jgi:hypothetical protein